MYSNILLWYGIVWYGLVWSRPVFCFVSVLFWLAPKSETVGMRCSLFFPESTGGGGGDSSNGGEGKGEVK